jgi:hypothetical protein
MYEIEKNDATPTTARRTDMSSTHKLGEDRNITGLLPAIVTLISIALVWMVLGREAAFLWTNFAFAVFTCLAFAAWWQTRSAGYLASLLYLLACTLMLCVRTGIIPGGREVAPAFAILLLASIVFLVFMLLTKQTKWRGRDILELAAEPVSGEAEAFTGRPRPAGSVDFTRAEIREFAAFARRKLIAMTFEEADRVVFVPVKMGNEFGFLFSREKDYTDETWVAFESDGSVSVNVSHADYLAYREDLDLDALCRSLADTFIDFLELHRGGRDSRILDRLDAMKVGVFS